MAGAIAASGLRPTPHIRRTVWSDPTRSRHQASRNALAGGILADRGTSHGLGFGSGSLIEHEDGSVEYRQTGKLIPAFTVQMRDVVGFSARKATRDDKKRLGASSLQQVLTVQGSGTTLAEVAVNHGTATKIEEWFRARPEFGAPKQAVASPSATGVSVADELAKLLQLRDVGVLTQDEFEVQKARLLG